MVAWMSLSTGSPHTLTSISTSSPIIPREERCGEMPPQQGQGDHQHAGQLSEGS